MLQVRTGQGGVTGAWIAREASKSEENGVNLLLPKDWMPPNPSLWVFPLWMAYPSQSWATCKSTGLLGHRFLPVYLVMYLRVYRSSWA